MPLPQSHTPTAGGGVHQVQQRAARGGAHGRHHHATVDFVGAALDASQGVPSTASVLACQTGFEFRILKQICSFLSSESLTRKAPVQVTIAGKEATATPSENPLAFSATYVVSKDDVDGVVVVLASAYADVAGNVVRQSHLVVWFVFSSPMREQTLTPEPRLIAGPGGHIHDRPV